MVQKDKKPASSKVDKFEIDDIKETEEEIDIENVVSEEDSTEPEKTIAEPKELAEDKDVLEQATQDTLPEPIEQKKKKRGFSWKLFSLIIVVLLIVAGACLGGYYYLKKKNKKDVPVAETVKTEEPAKKTEVTKTEIALYVNSDVGLNMREEPSATAKIVIVIPNGTKIVVLEEKGEWVKTTYQDKQGWIKKEYTQSENPLIYKNTEYGFTLTMLPSWSGYKIFKKVTADYVVLYVAIPTTDKNWSESSPIEKGYASLFAISIYEKSKWEIAKQEEGPKPTYLGDYQGKVITWSSGQATPTDLTARFSEIKTIISTYAAL